MNLSIRLDTVLHIKSDTVTKRCSLLLFNEAGEPGGIMNIKRLKQIAGAKSKKSVSFTISIITH